jgi:predicted pyridoxine 5'-phosphate oxidase superfamily flavin-nucleotide-binding protein
MSQHHRYAVLAATIALASACNSSGGSDTPRGSKEVAAVAATADTGSPLGATPAAGGVAAVTPTDAKSVTRATEYKLTDDNFNKFVAATDSLVALRKRDPATAAFLDKQITDNGSGTQVTANNAGRTHLENNPAVVNAISSAGLSVKDYFVASIAIAQAERFMGNPKSAPPTPTLGPNAEFLNAHKAQLQHLHAAQGR